MWLHITRDGVQGLVDDDYLVKAACVEMDEEGVVWKFPDPREKTVRVYELIAIFEPAGESEEDKLF
jgi:hypothetical protein